MALSDRLDYHRCVAAVNDQSFCNCIMLQTFEFMTTKYGPSIGGLVPLAKLVMAVPEDGCVSPGSALNNAQQIAGNIAVFVRGVCMFPDKASTRLFTLSQYGQYLRSLR